MKYPVAAGALLCAAPFGAWSADSPGPSTSSRPVEQVIVISHPLSAEGLALASEVLEGRELSRKLESSVGETVGREPGVHAASFGQAASRPVIHGLSGPRVRILEDRIDALDASVTSADHAVTIEPFVANRIEVLKGPSTLLYGSGAIGGVVDVHTGRIPHERPAEPFSGRLEARLGDNGDRRTAAGRLDGGAGRIAWHLDGFAREADPYEIPGFIESKPLREREAATGEEHTQDAPHHLPGSELSAAGGAAGFAVIGEHGFIGAAISVLEADYGLPGGHAHAQPSTAGEDADTDTPQVDLEQTRVDLEAGLADPLPGFESLNVRVGINDYRHREIEADGGVATTFGNDAAEGRVELTHRPVGGWAGALGLQVSHRHLTARGEEAFIPPVVTDAIGAFWVGERTFPRFDLEGGVRLESVQVDPQGSGGERFTAGAASLGLIVPFGKAWSLGIVLDYASRAPVAEELWSFGPHLTTRSFEVGNRHLDPEKSVGVSANLRYAGDRWFVSGTAYHNRFSGYIYEAPTGGERDGLPVFAYVQDDAEFTGLDLELRTALAEWQRGELEFNVRFDTVSGHVHATGAGASGDGDLPRIPPDRYGIGLTGRRGIVHGSIEHLWVRAQEQVADFELRTGAYRDLRAFLGVELPIGGQTLVTLFLQGRNLMDADQRQHSSFVKDFAPLPGRTVEAGLRIRF